MSTRISDLNPRLQAAVAAQLYGSLVIPAKKNAYGGVSAFTKALVAPKRLKQRRKGQNRWEVRFAAWILTQSPEITNLCWESMTLRIGNGVRYTPDFIGWLDGTLCAWEVKGFMRDDSAVKIKVAAANFPEIDFHLAWLENKCWRLQKILP